MNVLELIKELNEIEDKTLDVRIDCDELQEQDSGNQWVNSVEIESWVIQRSKHKCCGNREHSEVVLYGEE